MNDYNVLLIFFNNFDRFKLVFDAVKKAKPKNLFLYQDGPRNNKDIEGIKLCQTYIDSNIDWECNVYKKYQPKNYGCDPSEYIAQKWAFSIVDKCIVLEDDDVPGDDFFEFCWELLLKYEQDERICMICGMNHFDVYPATYPYDYFFVNGGCIWGWASWKRVVDSWDASYSWINDQNKLDVIKSYFDSKKSYRSFLKLAKERRSSKIEYYETILGVSQMLNHQLNIVPTKNLISNIGNSNGTHTANSPISAKLKTLYYKKTYRLDFPLKHPNYIFCNYDYDRRVSKLLSRSFFEKVAQKIRQFFNIAN